ncbi:hypothetical protein Athai_46810 [Actinocatenispora thailandica]|uniref:Gram-positive cocci surface proteins LPxTG domain-containing protein n=1 Tax=Actinocatenispora thailandica TaxID=227318 RepID=A0A7R7HZJ4_9ACTN|nr:hypothetical protein Athai_46810 [Actinocatenispora thailandica]
MFSPNPAAENTRVTLTVTVRYTSAGGQLTVDGLGGPLSVRYTPEEYACEMTTSSRMTCQVPTDEDAAVYTTTLVVRHLTHSPTTRWVTLTAHNDEGTVSTRVPVTLVSSSASPSGSATATLTASPSAPAAGGLPVTGTSLLLVGGIAAVLLGTGAVALLLARRRHVG